MASFSALSPVSVAVFGALNVAALTDLAPGGVSGILPPNATYPCVLFEINETQQVGGFGTKPGRGQLPLVEVSVHVFSQQAGMSEAQTIIAKAIELLADPPAVTGYGSWAIFHDATLDLGDQVVAGIVVHEVVAQFRLYVEEGH